MRYALEPPRAAINGTLIGGAIGGAIGDGASKAAFAARLAYRNGETVTIGAVVRLEQQVPAYRTAGASCFTYLRAQPRPHRSTPARR